MVVGLSDTQSNVNQSLDRKQLTKPFSNIVCWDSLQWLKFQMNRLDHHKVIALILSKSLLEIKSQF